MEILIVSLGVGVPLIAIGFFAAYKERKERRKEQEADLQETQG